MPKRQPPNPLESIESLMNSMRRLQSEAQRTLRRRAARPAATAPTGAEAQGGRTPGKIESERPRSLLRVSIERQLAEAVARILERLDLPSRSEIEALSRRVARLEKALATRAERRHVTPCSRA